LLLLSLALVFVVSLFWHIGPAPAQVQTFTYQGPAFDIPYCNLVAGASGYCRPGSVTGTATIYGYPSNYTGSITLGAVVGSLRQ
jgi:hypothetical protein